MIYEYAISIVAVLFIICIICALIYLVWSSTYVRAGNPVIPTTTMVLIQEESSPAESSPTSAMLQANEPLHEAGNNLRKREVHLQSTDSTASTSTVSQTDCLEQSQERETKNKSRKRELHLQSTESTTSLSTQSQSDCLDSIHDKEKDNHLRKTELLQNMENSPSSSAISQADDLKFRHSSNSQLLERDEETEGIDVLSRVKNDNEENQLTLKETEENLITNPNMIKIRLKFLDDTQKEVYGDLHEDVGSFKRKNIDIQLTPQSVVKLIFNGRMLTEDTSTLRHYGLYNNCVVHCFVSQRTETPQETTVSDSYNIDISEFFGFIVGAVMCFLWYLFIYHNYIFNIPSTISLLFITSMVLLTYNPLYQYGPIIDDFYVNYILDSFLPILGLNNNHRVEQETNQPNQIAD